jgi:uncharacterized protein YndB with AHSA1/START domain
MEMARVEANVVINRPLEEVFAFASNPENDMEWQSAVSEVEKTSEGPMHVRTTFRGADRFLGQRIDWTLEVIGYDLNRKVEFKIDAGPLQLEETVTFEPVDGGTRVTAVYEGDPAGFFKLAAPVLVRMFQGQVEGNLDNLKSVLEARAEAAG